MLFIKKAIINKCLALWIEFDEEAWIPLFNDKYMTIGAIDFDAFKAFIFFMLKVCSDLAVVIQASQEDSLDFFLSDDVEANNWITLFLNHSHRLVVGGKSVTF